MKGQISLKNGVLIAAVILSWPQASHLGVSIRSRVLIKEAGHWKTNDLDWHFRNGPRSLTESTESFSPL